MLKIRRIFSLIIVGGFLLAACGGQTAKPAVGEPAAGKSEAAVDPTACNLEAPESRVTINLISWPFAATEFYANEVKKCAQVDNIRVNVQLLDFTNVVEAMNLASSIGATSTYDIVHATNPEIATWGPEGWLLPLNDLVDRYRDEYDLDDIAQSAWEGATIDGQIFGVPFVGDTQVIAYRSDLFDQYDLAIPTTYDEIIAACGVLSDDPTIDLPFAIDFSAGWAMEVEFLAALRSYGGDYLNEDNTPAFAGPEGVAALEKMMEVKDACMGGAYLAYGYEAAEAGMNSGKIAFISIWATSMASMWKPDESEFSHVIEFAPAAAPKAGSMLGGTAWHNYYVIPATITNDPDLIFRIIMEATDLQSQKECAKLGVVTRQSVTEGVPNMAAVQETLNNGVGPYENNPAIRLVMVALGEELPLVADGSKTPQEALDAAARAYMAEATAQGFLP